MRNPRDRERRRSRRRQSVEEHGVIVARVQAGRRARLVDISSGGALLETTYRLLPGATVELQVETSERRASIHGRVLRCAVVRVHPSVVCYRGAIRFDELVPWFVNGEALHL